LSAAGREDRFLTMAPAFFWLCVYVGSGTALFQLALGLQPFLATPGLSPGGRTGILAGVLAAAAAAVMLRKVNQFGYGSVETVFALSAAWHSVARLDSGAVRNAIALAASLYLVRRGVTNILRGYERSAPVSVKMAVRRARRQVDVRN
jgi:hypothetical protein